MPMFGAQKTGGPTHLMSHALETMLRVLGLMLGDERAEVRLVISHALLNTFC